VTAPLQFCILAAAYRDVLATGPTDPTIELQAEPMVRKPQAPASEPSGRGPVDEQP